MKRIIRLTAALLALCFGCLALTSCNFEPGLYTWYGKQMEVGTLLTIDDIYEVDLQQYRYYFLNQKYTLDSYGEYYSNLYMYYQKQGDTESCDQIEANYGEYIKWYYYTTAEKNAYLKNSVYTSLLSYYAVEELARINNISLTDEELEIVDKTIEAYDAIEDKDFDSELTQLFSTREHYRRHILIHNELKNKLIRELYMPFLVEYASMSCYCVDSISITYSEGDSVSEETAYGVMKDVAALIEKRFDDVKLIDVSKLTDEEKENLSIAKITTLYKENDIILNAYGNLFYTDAGTILNNSNATLFKSQLEITSVLGMNEMSEITNEDSQFYVLIRREIDSNMVANNISEFFTTETSAYLDYADRIDLIQREFRVVISDTKAYKRIKMNTLY